MSEVKLEDRLEDLDRQIRQWRDRSKEAPSDFMENELRRSVNRWLMRPYTRAQVRETYLANEAENLEQEYLCYFDTKKFKEFLKKRGPKRWWQYVYAGCNAQIEHFLSEAGLDKAADVLRIWEPFHPVDLIKRQELTAPLRKYLVSIGYLYPTKRRLWVHPNLLYAQVTSRGLDSPFLSRDLIRGPYHDAANEDSLLVSDRKLWGLWKDLVALSYGDLPEYNQWRIGDHLSGEMRDSMRYYLELGRKMVPRRYCEWEADIERFEWVIPGPRPEGGRHLR